MIHRPNNWTVGDGCAKRIPHRTSRQSKHPDLLLRPEEHARRGSESWPFSRTVGSAQRAGNRECFRCICQGARVGGHGGGRRCFLWPAQANYRPRARKPSAHDIRSAGICRGRRVDELWRELGGFLSPRGILRGQDLQGSKSRRAPNRAAHAVQSCDQPQDRRRPWARNSGTTLHVRRRGDRMIGRRKFITLLGGAAAWPLAARAQQTAMPVIGFLSSSGSPSSFAHLANAFRQGLKETGYIEGQNVAIEYRWAQDQADRLPDLAADLVRRQVTVIAADTTSTIVAKAATTTIPIVYTGGGDPVKLGLVASLNRPGGNVTGVTFVVAELGAKRLGLLHELQPGAVRVGVLVDPNYAPTQSFVSDVQAAALSIGKQIEVFEASTGRDIDTAFASLAQKPVDALDVVGTGPLQYNRRVQLVTLAAYHKVPAIYPQRETAEAGGLMSYGTNLSDAYRQAGVYTGRIVKGEKPADLPVIQSIKFEFVINLNTARAFGLSFPPGLLAIADDVIE